MEDDKAYFEEDEDEDAEEESLMDDEGNPLLYLEDWEYSETEANYIQAYHSAYRDVRKELQRRRNTRGYTKRDNYNRPFGGKRTFQKGKWNKGSKSKFNRKGKSDDGGFKGSMGDLQNRTRCFNCNEMGHFARDCPLKTSSTTSSSKVSPTRPSRPSFLVLTLPICLQSLCTTASLGDLLYLQEFDAGQARPWWTPRPRTL